MYENGKWFLCCEHSEQDWCACTSHASRPSEAQVSLEELWDCHASLPKPGEEEKSPVCLQPLLPNHIITALKADIWQKAPESEQGEGSAAFVAAVISSPSSPARCWAVFVQGYHLPRCRVPPQLSPKRAAKAAEAEAVRREGKLSSPN